MTVIHDYDLIPDNQRAGRRLSGWISKTDDGVAVATNVRRKIDGRNVPEWPARDGDAWTPAWVVVTE